MSELSIRDQLKRLVELQKIDSEIFRLNKELKERPAYIEELNLQFEEKKQRLKELDEKLKNTKVDRKNLEIELQSKEEAITKANTQLSSLKTNKEYQAKLSEIEHFKADKSVVEEKIICSYDESDNYEKQILDEKKLLSEEEKKLQFEKKQVEETINKMQEELKSLELKRRQLTPEIEKNNLNVYERILNGKNGLAMVPVNGNACGGCYMNVPAQVINEIKMHERLIFCEMCSRLLYLEDDL